MDSRYKTYGLNCRLNAPVNPTLFHPQWLRANQLISDPEAESAKIKLLSENFTLVQIGNINLIVTDTTISLDTIDQSCFEPMRDLSIGIFTVLEAIPIKQIGINTHIHFELPNEEEWHHFGHTIVPKTYWNDIVEKPGTQKLVIKAKNPQSEKGAINITVEPSVRFPHALYIEINNHSEFPDASNAQDALMSLKTNWNDIVQQSKNMVEKIVSIK